jgi:enamine deaminase RidA (YjgF/YER057c/UK114 family)
MSHEIDTRLAAQGITLPVPASPAANYVAFVIEGGLLTISGQLPMENGAINILAQAQAALGDLGRIRRCVRLGGFVASAPDFTDQHKVINGASDLIAGILGEAGKHARAAVGVASLPLDAAVEVEALFAID